jgi:hypothetical protein
MNKYARIFAGSALAVAVSAPAAAVELWTGQDDNLDFHWRVNATSGDLEPVVRGANLELEDVLIAVLEINNVNGEPVPDGQELTAVSVIQADTVNGATIGFRPYDGGFNAATGLSVMGGEAGGGAMLALWWDYDDTTLGLNIESTTISSLSGLSCFDLDTCIAQASDGELWEVDGIVEAEDYWESLLTTNDPTQILQTSVAVSFGIFNAGLTVIDPAASDASQDRLLPGNNGPVDMLISGNINGGGEVSAAATAYLQGLIDDGYIATSDADLQKYVPVPAPLALMGVGLLAFRLVRRRHA